MPIKEKARQNAEPIPKRVLCQNNPEIISTALKRQVFVLARRCAISASLAEAIAPLVYGSLRA